MEHRHHGKSSANFLDSDEILTELNLNGNETFLDAGCGDGYISKKAIEDYLPEGKVYAVDAYPESVRELKEYVDENNCFVNVFIDYKLFNSMNNYRLIS